ncbi:hydantoin racemase [Xylaria nigripes]|nr:hydantoin racemase [Xylaria nigripes]
MSITLARGKDIKILLLNPNSSTSMTEGMMTVINDIDLPSSTEVYTYTATSAAPASINDANDIIQSTNAVTNCFDDHTKYHGYVIACYSVHPLVKYLQHLCGSKCAVTGIFEASVLAALAMRQPFQKWGIVTTGKFWERHLADGVEALLGPGADCNTGFAGVQSTGLNASDFHVGVDSDVVQLRLKDATKRLLDVENVSIIVMGCAGMAGLEGIIREAAKEKYDEKFAYSTLHVIDGVRAGLMQVDHMIKNMRLRPGWESSES